MTSLTAMLHELDCALTAFDIRITLAEADRARRFAVATQRWLEHQDHTRVSAGDWAVFETRNYAEHMHRRTVIACA